MLVVILGYAFGHFAAHPGYRVSDELVPVMMALVLATLGLLGLPIAIVEYKEQGILRRYRASPITLERLMVVLLLVQFAMFLLATALTIGLTLLLFGLRFSGNVGGVAVMAVVAAAALFAVGFLIGGLARSSRTAQAVSFGIFFPTLFVSGATIPRGMFPPWLRRIGDLDPVSYAVDGLTGTWIGQSVASQWLPVLVLLVTCVLAVLITRRSFRWS
jgi:ABC-2 type transport system permease protein